MRSRLLLVVLAGVLALVSAAAVLLLINSAEQRVLARFDTQTAYVAVLPVPVGTSLQDAVANQLISQESFPKQSLPDSRLTELPTTAAELFAASNIAPGQIILNSSFDSAEPETTLVSIPAGMLAVSVELALPARVGDFLSPGVEVAVFASYPTQGEGTSSFTDLLIPRAKVLAVGPVTAIGESDSSESEVPSSVITLALNQRDAQRLIYVTNSGGIVNLGLLSSASEISDDLTITPENAFN